MSKGKRGAGKGKKKRGKRGGRGEAPALGFITMDGRELPPLCPHDISIHVACESCGRLAERW